MTTVVLVRFHRVSERRGSIPKIRVTKNSAFHLHPSLAAAGGIFPARKDKNIQPNWASREEGLYCQPIYQILAWRFRPDTIRH